MNGAKRSLLVIFIFLTYVYKCLTGESTFQNATVVCVVYDEDIYIVSNGVTNSLKNSCAANISEPIRIVVNGSVNTIYENSITDIPYLYTLMVDDVGFKEIQPGAFKNLSNLRIMSLSNNQLKEIRGGTFSNLRIESLDLNNNKIVFLDKGAFQNLPHLQELYLQNNHLRRIQNGTFDNVAAYYLNLGNNQISEIEAGAFDGIYLQDVDYDIVLHLENNYLKKIDPDVFSILSIQDLNLCNNSIAALHPSDLKNILSLRVLYLCGNNLTEVPDGVFNGSDIRILDLSRNQISTIASHAFDDMQNLEGFYISNNKLKTWNSNWFSNSWAGVGVADVGEIGASHNNIEEIPTNAFKNLPEINFAIELQWNGITRISDGGFNGLKKLKLLNVSHNGITEWNRKLLENVNVTGVVDMSYNKIECPRDGPHVLVPKSERVVLEECSNSKLAKSITEP